MRTSTKFVLGAGLGAGLAYFLYAQTGARRHGAQARATSLIKEKEIDDERLAGRIRSMIGRRVSHSSSIDVSVQNGRVTLRGPILVDEEDRLIPKILFMKGVRDLDNQLEVHEEPGGAPGLQGGPGRRRNRSLWRILTGKRGQL
ncbi:MAG: BON domain-containing protein [Elusimicrobia bacterium]|nr:BON domain-containing protein [Elusimicrobiota bacterium]